jgi:hypothetical protein
MNDDFSCDYCMNGGTAMADLLDVPNLSMKHLRTVVTLARFGSFIAAAS